ncbi:MAG: Trk family potassium uptake protein [Thermoanaerobacteraceae bacterium]|nr:Trk family potassium uptake protein [Thermoanaerobacteraceae bacterium]
MVRVRLTPTQGIVLGFACVILVGTLLLMLPVSSAAGRASDFLTALFTATSAVCVTGLVVVDTGTYWSTFGQGVIALLIQIGGLGWMSVVTLLALLIRKRISLGERLLMQEALNRENLGGVVALTKRIILTTFVLEGVGALVLSWRFARDFGWAQGVYYGVFHAVSAFNNAGFDVLGPVFGPYCSLTPYVQDITINIVISSLLILGGIGFPVIMEVLGFRKSGRLSLHSRIVLLTTLVLIVAGTLTILAIEWDNPNTLGPLPPAGKGMAAYFQAVTPRTAGFNTVSIDDLRPASQYAQVILMFIGASPAGTGGGIKTTTFTVLVLAIAAVVRGRQEVEFGGRRIPWARVIKALAIAALSFFLVIAVSFILLLTEGEAFLPILYEVTSAFATVGLTTGLTPDLTPVGRCLLILTMFAGRVGPVSLAMAIWKRQVKANIHLPEEQVILG